MGFRKTGDVKHLGNVVLPVSHTAQDECPARTASPASRVAIPTPHISSPSLSAEELEKLKKLLAEQK